MTRSRARSAAAGVSATIEAGAGTPDGITVDAEGCVWVALWDGWAVRRYGPDGTHLGTIDVPAARVTKPAFGGPALTDLYITTAAAEKPDPRQAQRRRRLSSARRRGAAGARVRRLSR